VRRIVFALATLPAFAASAATQRSQQPQQPPGFIERVDVARVVIDTRVVDSQGLPIRGLEIEDFAVRLNGRSARVESVSWVGDGESSAPGAEAPVTAPGDAAEGAAAQAPGRLIVLLFQKDLEPTRIVGLMRMLIHAQGFLETLTPDDRVAVLSFDSHLKIWLDFTSDHERLRRVFERGILLEQPTSIEARGYPSIVERLSQQEGRQAYGVEKALRLIADAIAPLPGSKSLVLVGHGFGRYGATGVTMEPDYDDAIAALVAARASVFSLDVTQADYHSLEAGLQLVAAQTGGFYARTHRFSSQAMRRLTGALAGYYVLIVESSEPVEGRPDFDVKLTRRRGTVLARSIF